jgi:Cdc6-like AAA superfamily ATPase
MLTKVSALDKKDMPDDTRIARNLTPPSSRFVGRRAILDRLDDHFRPRSERHKPRREFLLSGMGGAGKTQTALRFAQQYAERYASVIASSSSC